MWEIGKWKVIPGYCHGEVIFKNKCSLKKKKKISSGLGRSSQATFSMLKNIYFKIMKIIMKVIHGYNIKYRNILTPPIHQKAPGL